MFLSDASSYLRSLGTDEFLRFAQSFSYAAIFLMAIYVFLNPIQSIIPQQIYDSFFLIPYLDLFLAALAFAGIEINFYDTKYSEESKTRKGVAIFLLFLVILGSLLALYFLNQLVFLFFFALCIAKDSQVAIFREDSADAHEVYRKTYLKSAYITISALFLYALIMFAGPAFTGMGQVSSLIGAFTNLWVSLWFAATIYARFSN